MNDSVSFEVKTKKLIDDLKSVCANYGLGNDGNEFKIITQIFLYKFLNDKFITEIKKINTSLSKSKNIEKDLNDYSKNDYKMMLLELNENTAKFYPSQFISSLFEKQNEPNFSNIFDNSLLEIANQNSDLFSVFTSTGEKIRLFENISKYVSDKRDEFCKAIVNKIINFSFEEVFEEGFDFFSTIFEYLIKDYNSNSGGKYAEYFTPHTVSKIIASCLVDTKVKDVRCYDPSAGSGTLLMNIANIIGEDKCTIYSQDISQKSSHLLRLNLILNNLVHSIPNIVQGNTILEPFHKSDDGNLSTFDFIVSNPPFKLDFSDYRDDLETKHNNNRFFAGIPKIAKKKKDSMSIYQLFIQHILFSLNKNGKASIVVPTGFLSAKSIDMTIREEIINKKILTGVISMPSNIFATTGTNVSIIFLNKENNNDEVILIDASSLGEKIKIDDTQRTILSEEDEKKIIKVFKNRQIIDEFSVTPKFDEIKKNKYSLNAGSYFDVKVEYKNITNDQFKEDLNKFKNEIEESSKKSRKLEEKLYSYINEVLVKE